MEALCTWKVQALVLVYWSLPVVASSVGNKQDLRFLPRALTSIQLPPCDIFLAPSTISGSVSVRTK